MKSPWNLHAAIKAILPVSQGLEEFRRELLDRRSKGVLWIFFSLLGWAVTAFLVVPKNESALFLVLIGPVITVLIIYEVFVRSGTAKYVARYKKDVVRALLREIEPGLSYRPNRGISEAMFTGSQLFRSKPDRFATEDLFHGKIGHTQVSFAEIHAEEKRVRRDADGSRRTTWTDLFRGVFFIADFHKDFRSIVTVMPDFAEKTFGWFGKKLQNFGGGASAAIRKSGVRETLHRARDRSGGDPLSPHARGSASLSGDL